ncbi:hypothetical protein [Acerihabitans arboris]|uniref:Membrane protein 6-pyruvoyl-tetrahydropterin synthase-related domain-containing protein n=1 Tax=Acerihabitans arboris TaxID=2691583 RepID=A0A845S9G0_9GAMM|nr:hypothetical protein [Acerihabitans arboris]NDL61360.1 hypothetical protein [Acerihabitans arboris]
MANNQFPPLFDYWSPGQFGYSWQLFYPPLTSLLFLAAKALTFNTADIIIQMKMVFFLIFVIAFFSAFYAAKRQHSSSAAGFLCAILLISSGYFLTNIYIRFALGESLAMALMPLFIRGCGSLISDRKDIWLLPFSALGVFLSNIPSVVVISIFFILFAAVNFKLITIKPNLAFFSISLLFILSISAFYWAPLLYHIRFSDIFATSGKLLKYDDLLKFSSGLTETLLSLPSTYGVSNPGMFLSVGVIQLLLAVAYLKWGKSAAAKKMIIISLLFIIATTHLLPWNKIPDSVPILKLIQFPWRLLSCATAIIALHASGMLAAMLARKKTLVTLLACLCIASMYPSYHKAMSVRYMNVDTSSLYDDYLNNSNVRPVNFDHLKINDFAFFANPQAPIIGTAYINGYPEMVIRSAGTQTVTLPYIMYAGYYLLVDGNRVAASRVDSGLVGVTLDGGEHTVRLAYQRYIVIIPALISLLSLLVTALFFTRRRDRISALSARYTNISRG